VVHRGALGTLLLTAVVLMASPGPSTLSLVATGSAYGVRRTLPYFLGIVLGTIAVLVVVGAGLTAAVLAVTPLRVALLVASAAYIGWLAWRIATAPPPGSHRPDGAAPSGRGGVLFGLANPKSWLALSAIFNSARVSAAAVTDAAVKVLLLAGLVVVVHAAWLVAGSGLPALLRHPGHHRVVNVVLAAALVGSVVLAIVR